MDIRALLSLALAATMLVDSADACSEQMSPIVDISISYPSIAIDLHREADCDGFFDLDDEGVPINVRVECTDPIFKANALEGIHTMRFAPLNPSTGIETRSHSNTNIVVWRSHPACEVTRTGYVYPLVFRLDP